MIIGRQETVKSIAENGGWLRFDHWMRVALYHPEWGYYSAKIRGVGSRGDFTTFPQQSDLLGRALAKWAKTQLNRLPRKALRHVVETGGGTGQLAFSFLTALGWRGRFGLRYHLVEVSIPLRRIQQEKLKGFTIFWHDSIAEAVIAAEGIAVFFSNELVDAFPCRRLRWSEGCWWEWGLEIWENQIRSTPKKLHPEQLLELDSSCVDPTNALGVLAIEIHQDYRLEMARLTENLTRGILLTIDYGDRFPAVYHRQPHGTLRGYIHHQRVDGDEIYERIGQQDLTADVNFSDLEKWGNQLGWENESWETQREFIHRQLGIIPLSKTADAQVLDPIGAGGAFKVLQQSYRLASEIT